MHSGSWGSVCDDDWDVVDANVVCRQLHCGLALPVPRPLAFGQGRGPIFLDNVECRGQEASLSECGSRGWGVHNCFHYEDVAVLCDGEEGGGCGAEKLAGFQVGLECTTEFPFASMARD